MIIVGIEMPSLKHHLEFDELRLKKNCVIYEDTNGTAVHKRLDKNTKKYGRDHRKLDEWHTPEGVRDMIDNFISSLGTIRPETATDYVRIAYGHLILDKTASRMKRERECTYGELNWREVYTRTYRLFRRYEYHKTCYKPRR